MPFAETIKTSRLMKQDANYALYINYYNCLRSSFLGNIQFGIARKIKCEFNDARSYGARCNR